MTCTQDARCVAFLQWALPRLGMRWAGFRKVRRQVCRRIRVRLRALGLESLDQYRALLERDEGEWTQLERLCRVTISRFLRDRGVWDTLRTRALPELAQQRDGALHCWSAGCASGEEPYSLVLVWAHAGLDPEALDVLGTDVDPHMVKRARRARYSEGSLRELPQSWRQRAFEPVEGREPWGLRERFRRPVRFSCSDLWREIPAGPFDLVLCRNLVFTYYEFAAQRELLERFVRSLRPGGLLVVGKHERPPEHRALRWYSQRDRILQRADAHNGPGEATHPL